MSGASTVDDGEKALIKTMLGLVPPLSKQAILSYFTRPGRDLNHRLISEIADGKWPEVSPAPIDITMAYIARCLFHSYPTVYQQGQGASIMQKKLGTMELVFWPVGQGLFTSGEISSPRGAHYEWVYDCGSSSGATERDIAIKTYRKSVGKRQIDLVTLSHYHADHINGIVALLKGLRVRTLLLPYLPLWKRLLIALTQGLTEADGLFAFYEDPTGYLSRIDGGEIGEILFVPAARPDDEVPGPEEPRDPEEPESEGGPEYGKPPPESDGDPTVKNQAGPAVRFLRPKGRIVMSTFWEFVPYNDAALQSFATASFVVRTSRIARVFANNLLRRKLALKVLARIATTTFGGGNTIPNQISLFLYAGPTDHTALFDPIFATAPVRSVAPENNLAVLMTGDGYLDDTARLNAMQSFFTAARMDRAGVLQVMHHGSEKNWHAGLAAVLKPAVSVFSSDPSYKHGHPSPEVLHDFWPWCAVKVDKITGFHLVARIVIP